jgi:hypothetical protein
MSEEDTYRPYNEKELLSQMAAGDQQALTKLYDQYNKPVYA